MSHWWKPNGAIMNWFSAWLFSRLCAVIAIVCWYIWFEYWWHARRQIWWGFTIIIYMSNNRTIWCRRSDNWPENSILLRQNSTPAQVNSWYRKWKLNGNGLPYRMDIWYNAVLQWSRNKLMMRTTSIRCLAEMNWWSLHTVRLELSLWISGNVTRG